MNAHALDIKQLSEQPNEIFFLFRLIYGKNNLHFNENCVPFRSFVIINQWIAYPCLLHIHMIINQITIRIFKFTIVFFRSLSIHKTLFLSHFLLLHFADGFHIVFSHKMTKKKKNKYFCFLSHNLKHLPPKISFNATITFLSKSLTN